MAKYQQYEEYKDSGIDWLGEVPSHWEVIKGGYIGDLFSSESVLESHVVNDGDLPFIKVSTLSTDSFKIDSPEWFVSRKADRFVRTQKNYIVFPKRGAAIFTNKVNIVNISSVIDPNLMGWKINERAMNQYVALLLKTRRLDDIADVSTVPQINNKHINPQKFPLPPIKEQKLILSFLNHETAKIDTLIEKQQTLISLLKEKRQAVISHAVTKGLNPDVPMKDSGVEWLGEVPAHWDIVKLSYKMKLLSGDGITSQDIEPVGQYSVYGGNGLRGYTTRYNCDGHYVLIGRQGALCGNINLAKGKFFATEHAVVVYPYQDFDITFLSEFLRFMDLGQYSVSAAQPGISVERINGLKILVPPYDEQIEIGIYIKKIVENFKSLSMKANQQIQLLQERRTALISAAVTGKIDVRGWLAPE